MGRRTRAAAVALTALGVLSVLATHRPAGGGADPADPTTAVVSVAAWVAWALVGYLLLAVAATAVGHLATAPTASRRGPRARRGRAIAPRLIRRLVDAAVGVTAATVVATAAGPAVAAYADAGPPTPTPAATSSVSTPADVIALDWPGLDRPRRKPPGQVRTGRQKAQASSPARLLTSPPRRGGGPSAEIVVRAGDSLWTLTARQLGPGASAAEIAAAWPALYAANRAVIGPNPGLIHPGQRLTPLASDARSPR